MATEQKKTVKVQLVRSPIGTKESHRATVRGMINKLSYLVKVL
jgi:large subunit ribosomal protein L30